MARYKDITARSQTTSTSHRTVYTKSQSAHQHACAAHFHTGIGRGARRLGIIGTAGGATSVSSDRTVQHARAQLRLVGALSHRPLCEPEFQLHTPDGTSRQTAARTRSASKHRHGERRVGMAHHAASSKITTCESTSFVLSSFLLPSAQHSRAHGGRSQKALCDAASTAALDSTASVPGRIKLLSRWVPRRQRPAVVLRARKRDDALSAAMRAPCVLRLRL